MSVGMPRPLSLTEAEPSCRGDLDPVAVTRQGLIHRVVHHLVDEMVQTLGPVSRCTCPGACGRAQALPPASAQRRGVLDMEASLMQKRLSLETGFWAALTALNLDLAFSIYHRLSIEAPRAP